MAGFGTKKGAKMKAGKTRAILLGLEDRVTEHFVNKLPPGTVTKYNTVTKDNKDSPFKTAIDSKYGSLESYALSQGLSTYAWNIGKNSLKAGAFIGGLWIAGHCISPLADSLENLCSMGPEILKETARYVKPASEALLGTVGYFISDELFRESSKNGEWSSKIAEIITKGASINHIISSLYSLPSIFLDQADKLTNSSGYLKSNIGLGKFKLGLEKLIKNVPGYGLAALDVLTKLKLFKEIQATSLGGKIKEYAGKLRDPAIIFGPAIGVELLTKLGLTPVNWGGWEPLIVGSLKSAAAYIGSGYAKHGFWKGFGKLGSIAYLTKLLGQDVISGLDNPIREHVLDKVLTQYGAAKNYLLSLPASAAILEGTSKLTNYIKENAGDMAKDALIPAGAAIVTFIASRYGLPLVNVDPDTASLIGQYAAPAAAYATTLTDYVENKFVKYFAKAGAVVGLGLAIGNTDVIMNTIQPLVGWCGNYGSLVKNGIQFGFPVAIATGVEIKK